jgi:fatty acid desaturase
LACSERARNGKTRDSRKETTMLSLLAMTGSAAFILWIIAAILVIWGIVTILRGGVLAGIVLIIVGLLVGPGGVSIFK